MKTSRYSLRTLLWIVAMAALVIAFVTDRPHIHLIATFMSNSDIVLESADCQIQTTGATSIITMFGKQARPALIEKLDNPSTFAAAHVALTEIDSPGCSGRTHLDLGNQTQSYHRMPLRIDSNGAPLFDFEKQPPLKRWWQEYLARKESSEKLSVCSGVVIFGELDLRLLEQ